MSLSAIQIDSHALHTLSHCTSYPLFYFIICFLLHSHHICIYIYSLVFLFHSFYCFYVIFILLSCFIFLSCTFHWADLSWLTFHYLLYPVWLCMWQIIKNLEPWTLIKGSSIQASSKTNLSTLTSTAPSAVQIVWLSVFLSSVNKLWFAI